VGAVGACEFGSETYTGVVLSIHGGCRGRHWSNQRCGVIRCRGLGLAGAKRASIASRDG
jgi:hypothetical protein